MRSRSGGASAKRSPSPDAGFPQPRDTKPIPNSAPPPPAAAAAAGRCRSMQAGSTAPRHHAKRGAVQPRNPAIPALVALRRAHSRACQNRMGGIELRPTPPPRSPSIEAPRHACSKTAILSQTLPMSPPELYDFFRHAELRCATQAWPSVILPSYLYEDAPPLVALSRAAG